MNIVIIGFMGSGKTTLSRALAHNLDSVSLDLDSILSFNFGCSIAEFFSKFGEDEFRKAESKLISWVANNVKNAVISTGGGAPIFNDVRKMGKTIFLDAPFNELLNRLDSSELEKRPLFKDKNKALELFNSRIEIYKNSADFTISALESNEKQIEKIKALIQTN